MTQIVEMYPSTAALRATSRPASELAAALADAEVTEPDDVGVFEIHLEADDKEQALQRVWDAVAASGTDDHIVFFEHPDLPEHWRRVAGGPARSFVEIRCAFVSDPAAPADPYRMSMTVQSAGGPEWPKREVSPIRARPTTRLDATSERRTAASTAANPYDEAIDALRTAALRRDAALVKTSDAARPTTRPPTPRSPTRPSPKRRRPRGERGLRRTWVRRLGAT